MNKSKVTFVIPKSLKNELSESVIKDGYGFRGKSKWVIEAIEALLVMPDFTELVYINDNMAGFEITETIVANKAIKKTIEEAIILVRQDYPSLEGVQSNIVRTAILQRLLRKSISGHRKTG